MDYMWVQTRELFGQRVAQAFANNGDLVANILDNLSGSSALISVRGRATLLAAVRARGSAQARKPMIVCAARPWSCNPNCSKPKPS